MSGRIVNFGMYCWSIRVVEVDKLLDVELVDEDVELVDVVIVPVVVEVLVEREMLDDKDVDWEVLEVLRLVL